MNSTNTPTFSAILSYRESVPYIPTVEYGNIEVHELPEEIKNFYQENTQEILSLLQGDVDLEKTKQRKAKSIDILYPEDAHGNTQQNNQTNGIIRAEELVTFTTQDPETGDIYYIARSRPDLKGTNTPGQLDPGVFSHGGLGQAGVINAWRYIADKVGKNDPELTEEEYRNYLEKHPFPRDFGLLDTGNFIIANGSNARNKKDKENKKEFEPRTSGLLQIRTIIVYYTDFQKILTSQNQNTELPTEYSCILLQQNTHKNWTPKHQAVHELLQAHQIQIQTQSNTLQENISQRIDTLL